jgi:hypothetical protein
VVTGPVQGAVAIGKDIRQTQELGSMKIELSDADRQELSSLFAGLRRDVSAAIPEPERRAALERIDELEQTVTSEQPDLTTVQYVKQWFAQKLPAAAGLVASVLVHPLVGAIVQQAGTKLADTIT